jgi:hypothetical protein
MASSYPALWLELLVPPTIGAFGLIPVGLELALLLWVMYRWSALRAVERDAARLGQRALGVRLRPPLLEAVAIGFPVLLWLGSLLLASDEIRRLEVHCLASDDVEVRRSAFSLIMDENAGWWHDFIPWISVSLVLACLVCALSMRSRARVRRLLGFAPRVVTIPRWLSLGSTSLALVLTATLLLGSRVLWRETHRPVPRGFQFRFIEDDCTEPSQHPDAPREDDTSWSRRGMDSIHVAGPWLTLRRDGVTGPAMDVRGPWPLPYADLAAHLALQCRNGGCTEGVVRVQLVDGSSTAALARLVDVLRPGGFRRVVFILSDHIVEARPLFGPLDGVHYTGLEVLLRPTGSRCVPIVPNEPLEKLVDTLLRERHSGPVGFCSPG